MKDEHFMLFSLPQGLEASRCDMKYPIYMKRSYSTPEVIRLDNLDIRTGGTPSIVEGSLGNNGLMTDS